MTLVLISLGLTRSQRPCHLSGRFLVGVSLSGSSVKGWVVHKPVDTLTLSAEDGEALIARVHRSDLPRVDVATVEWVIRMYFHVVFALQEAKLSVKRLRAF